MPSERQIAANRANARKSSGPRSASGKKRASRNAIKHGLNTPISGAAVAREIEALARQIAGDPKDRARMALAREAAEAQLELARVQRVGVAFIERTAAVGRLEQRKLFRTFRDEAAFMALSCLGVRLGKTQPKCAVDPLPLMPTEEPARTTEAIRRALPDLLRLNRYERRAAARRDRTIRHLTQSKD
ncbi:MAG: hypothetical protein C5B56_05600 [Proteobacteria bacterium]|nr:MAG: hypothetical protein C5B56_05600 [Pseudomonadota bacterium]